MIASAHERYNNTTRMLRVTTTIKILKYLVTYMGTKGSSVTMKKNVNGGWKVRKPRFIENDNEIGRADAISYWKSPPPILPNLL